MDVRSGRARVRDLAFQIYGRALHPEWFSMRAHRRFTQVGWEVDVWITEAGHAIFWKGGAFRLAEVLNGTESPLPTERMLFQAPVRRESSTTIAPASQIEYQACFYAERTELAVFNHLSDELLIDAPRNGLLHRFAPATRLDPSPLSRIDVEFRPRRLLIQTFHTFPEVRTIVRTQSLLELRSPRP